MLLRCRKDNIGGFAWPIDYYYVYKSDGENVIVSRYECNKLEFRYSLLNNERHGFTFYKSEKGFYYHKNLTNGICHYQYMLNGRNIFYLDFLDFRL